MNIGAMTGSGRFESDARAAVYAAIFRRRDIRNYRPDDVPDEALARVLLAAHHAPSVGFMQPWRFLVVRDRGARARVYDHFRAVNERAAKVHDGDRQVAYQALKLQGILDAPVNLVVTCDGTIAGDHVLGRFTIPETDLYSTCLAIENLWLAARAEGLGVGWMSIMDEAAIREIFGIPGRVSVVAYLTLGYPVEFPETPMLANVGWASRRPLDDVVVEERWDARVPEGSRLRVAMLDAPDAIARLDRSIGHAALETRASHVDHAPEGVVARLDALTKPVGSLGRLESLASKLAIARGVLHPSVANAHLVLFAGDHGVVEERVSAYRPESTVKMVYQFLAGGAVVNAFARENDVAVHVVDVGVRHDFGAALGLGHAKVRHGTRNLAREAAMTPDECTRAIEAGRREVARIETLDLLCVGEMGIGNSTSAAALAMALLGLSLDDAVGRGTGISDERLERKRRVVARAIELHSDDVPADDAASRWLARVGGFEIAAIVGAIEEAARRNVPVMLDGYITGVAALVAAMRDPSVRRVLVASHVSAEPGHRHVLDALGEAPLLDLGMRLGEGSGAVLAVPLARAAARLLRDVRTHEEANVSRDLDR